MRRLTYILAPALAACASGGKTSAYVAPTEQTVVGSIEVSAGTTPANLIWVTNRSTVPIRVYSVTLRSCENVKQRCEPTPLHLRVVPGQRALLQRVEPRDQNGALRFSYSFGWQADSGGTAALAALAANGSDMARTQLAGIAEATQARRAQVGAVDEELGAPEIRALGPRVAALRIVPDSLVMHPGQVMLVRQLRVLAVGAEREPLGRVRAYRWRVSGLAAARLGGDTVEARGPGRATIEVRLPDEAQDGRAAPLAPALVQIVVQE